MNKIQIHRLTDEIMEIFSSCTASLEKGQIWILQNEVLCLLKGFNAAQKYEGMGE